ncbi:MAG: methyltransferase domain-containing protein [Nitrospirota bacterium]
MEKLEESFSWSRFYSYRKKFRREHPSVFGLKIRKKLLDVVVEEVKGEERILDVGASDRVFGEKVLAKFPRIVYKTMDIDREQAHDYYSLDDISEQFDVIILSEVIEHLSFSDGMSMLQRLRELLNSNGKIIISTPNLHHPHRYWDSDHRTPYRYDEISGALLSKGFRVEKVYRIYNDQFLRRFFRIYVMSHLHKYLDIDFAKSIVVVAAKE